MVPLTGMREMHGNAGDHIILKCLFYRVFRINRLPCLFLLFQSSRGPCRMYFPQAALIFWRASIRSLGIAGR